MKTDKIGIMIFILAFALMLAIVSSISAQSSNKEENAELQLSGGATSPNQSIGQRRGRHDLRVDYF